ncbi:MAG: hypothetical protein ABIJ45_02825 [Candidatus Zixiibacteriota bacterium]
MAEITRSARIVEIIGQILRNRYGSLSKKQLRNLANAAYSSGLKFLNSHLSITRNEKAEIIDFIKSLLQEKTNLSEDDCAKFTKRLFLLICYGICYSVIRKIANSLGSDKLMPIFKEIGDSRHDSPAIQLITVAIELEFTKKIPKDNIQSLFAELEKNVIAQRLLQEIMIGYLYLNYVNITDKQWISDTLKIPIDFQRKLQYKTNEKLIAN